MQAYYNNFPLYNFNQIQKPMAPIQPIGNLLNLASQLKQIIFKQQVFINALAVKQQQTEEKLLESLENQYFAQVKQEQEVINSVETFEAPEQCKQEFEDTEGPKIMRRNGFKSPSSDNSSSSGKSKKQRIPSKAKHLWINYGRRIIEYATENTEGAVREKIQKLFGRLTSKKDYREVFGLNESDSEEERQFKIELGTLAIEFLKTKSASSFEGTKHKDDMVAQWNAVATYIEKLIN